MGRKVIDNPNMCSLVYAMNVIGGKWKPIILYLLANGSMRFGKLLMFTPTISKKVLTEQLKELEEDGLIIRTKYPEVPPRVEYSLSEKGKGLLPVLKALSDWTFDTFEEENFEQCRIVTL
ncbi:MULTISPECIES: winged helix-turn-helix transcriptional regulator [Flammeovirga]|uniref:Helix-turn-helix transcriptional regulator n=1 Tax=Flammeovirga agarivorans TaxID=2726742 RepID=A0A7X8SQ36_9BACT|nr:MULTISPECIES: helix-turn-helix domain-containing protein [Flammeovirga]NLR94335.1 helix-turn-helix transcriptional regulator [Flammeovirga agarivorans]